MLTWRKILFIDELEVPSPNSEKEERKKERMKKKSKTFIAFWRDNPHLVGNMWIIYHSSPMKHTYPEGGRRRWFEFCHFVVLELHREKLFWVSKINKLKKSQRSNDLLLLWGGGRCRFADLLYEGRFLRNRLFLKEIICSKFKFSKCLASPS